MLIVIKWDILVLLLFNSHKALLLHNRQFFLTNIIIFSCLSIIREVRGFSQSTAAEMLGISTDTLSNYQRGKSYPDIPVLRKIENVYEVRYDQLIFLPIDFGLTINNKKEQTTTTRNIKEGKQYANNYHKYHIKYK